MSRNLVICIDGTWNAPGQKDRDPVHETETGTRTNVLKTWEILTGEQVDPTRPYGAIARLRASDGLALYINGVGSQGSKLQQGWAGAAGTGTSARIRDAYRFLAERWEPGDRIYGFGFSRGAYAVRSLFSFIEKTGIPARSTLVREEELFELFKSYQNNTASVADGRQPAHLEFLGIWDTVGALAFGTGFGGTHNINPVSVKHVYHALALDETRSFFRPSFFPLSSDGNQNISETWFCGAHSNIGGGYKDENLSNIALYWILQKAREHGLNADLENSIGWLIESVEGTQRDSYEEFFRQLKILGELISGLGLGKDVREIPQHHYLHQSVLESKRFRHLNADSLAEQFEDWPYSRISPWND